MSSLFCHWSSFHEMKLIAPLWHFWNCTDRAKQGLATFVHLLDLSEVGDASHIIKNYTDQPKGALYIICSLIHVSSAISETTMIWFSTILDNTFIRALEHSKLHCAIGDQQLQPKNRQSIFLTDDGPDSNFYLSLALKIYRYFKETVLSLVQSQLKRNLTNRELWEWMSLTALRLNDSSMWGTEDSFWDRRLNL